MTEAIGVLKCGRLHVRVSSWDAASAIFASVITGQSWFGASSFNCSFLDSSSTCTSSGSQVFLVYTSPTILSCILVDVSSRWRAECLFVPSSTRKQISMCSLAVWRRIGETDNNAVKLDRSSHDNASTFARMRPRIWLASHVALKVSFHVHGVKGCFGARLWSLYS